MSKARKLVVVVDDDPGMLKALHRLLAAKGFETLTYPSAEAFLASGAGHGAICLVLDIHLSGISGIELRRRLTVKGSIVPVIFMTAFDDEATHREALDAGCVAYLHKPFQADLLFNAIDRCRQADRR
jgi:FixJ family two-component response regulator